MLCVNPISALNFKAGKIELNDIHKQDLTNYDSIQQLAKLKYCDFLIEKKGNLAYAPDYDIYNVLARRKWINPKYVFGEERITLQKNTPIEEIVKKIYEISVKAAKITFEKTHELAKSYIR